MKTLLVVMSMSLTVSTAFAETISFVKCESGKTKVEAIAKLNSNLQTYPNAILTVSAQRGYSIDTSKIKSISSVTVFSENGVESACVSLIGENYESNH